MYRVLKPGGRLVICEFSKPPVAILRAGLLRPTSATSCRSSPTARARTPPPTPTSPSRSASGPTRATLSQWIRAAGFTRVAYRNLTAGIVALHRGRKPARCRRARIRREAPRTHDATDQRRLHREPSSPRCAAATLSAHLSGSARSSSRRVTSADSPTRSSKASRPSKPACSTRCTFADEIADVTSRYLLEAGGKRVRPMLTLLTAQLGDGNTDDVITRGSGDRDHPPRARCTTTT